MVGSGTSSLTEVAGSQPSPLCMPVHFGVGQFRFVKPLSEWYSTSRQECPCKSRRASINTPVPVMLFGMVAACRLPRSAEGTQTSGHAASPYQARKSKHERNCRTDSRTTSEACRNGLILEHWDRYSVPALYFPNNGHGSALGEAQRPRSRTLLSDLWVRCSCSRATEAPVERLPFCFWRSVGV